MSHSNKAAKRKMASVSERKGHIDSKGAIVLQGSPNPQPRMLSGPKEFFERGLKRESLPGQTSATPKGPAKSNRKVFSKPKEIEV